MSYRNGVMIPEPPGKGRHARHYYYNEGEPSPYDLANNSSPADCYDHDEWDRRSRKVSSSTERYEKRNRASWSRHEREREDEHESMDYYFDDNNERLSSRNRRSQSPSSFNNNNSNRTIILSSNVDRNHQRSRKKSTHRRQWDSLRISIDNKLYHDGNHDGSFSSQRDSSSQDFPSYERSRSRSRKHSSRSSYYDSGNESKFSDPYQSRVDEFIRENLNASQHKYSQPEREINKSSNPTKKKELLEKLLQVKDPDFERELDRLIREKIGKHSRGSEDREGDYQRSDYEQRERLPSHKIEGQSRSRNHRSPSPSSHNRSNRDWYDVISASDKIPLEIRAASSTSPMRGIRYSDLEDGDTALYDADSTYRAKTPERFIKESSDLQRDESLDESDNYTNIADSRSEHDMWSTIHQVLKEQKQERGFWQSSISKKGRDPITPDETSQIEDPTIRNILKSIGFDFEMSKRMQERAKQVSSQPDYLRTDKGGQYDQQGIPNVPTEMNEGLMKRTQMQILTIEKSLPPHSNTSVLSSSTNSPAALCQSLLPTPRTNADQQSPSPQPVGYGQLASLSAEMSPNVLFLSQQQSVHNQYSNVQFDSSLYGQNPDYDSTNSLVSTSALKPSIPSNRKATSLFLKSDHPALCATASASLPGFFRRHDRSPYTYTRHGSPRSPCLSPEREWSSRKSRSPPPPRRDRSPLFPRNSHKQYYRSRRSRDRSPDSWKERDRSPLHQIHSRVSHRTKSSSWFHREKTSPKYDHTLQWHSSFPTRYESPRKGRSLKQSWSHTDSKHGSGAYLDESGSMSGDSVEDPESLSPQEIEQMKTVRLDHISKMEALQNVLNKLRKQQNEMMRKKQRVKDGHKDPLLLKNASLQQEINKRISLLTEAIEELSETLESFGVKLESFQHSKKWTADQLKTTSQHGFQVESSDQFPPTLGRGLSCESLQSSKGDPPFPLKRKVCLGKQMDDDSMSSDDKSSSGKKMPPFPLQKSSLLPESSADERKMSGNEKSGLDNSCKIEHQNLNKAADLQISPPGENEQEKNNDDCEDEEDQGLPEEGRQENEMEIVKKEESIEKTEESEDKESHSKDPEISKPSDLDNYIKSVSDDLVLKEETNQPVSGFKKNRISIKLTGKTGIKPVQDPVVPSEIPVGKILGRKKGRGLKSNVAKKLVSKEIEEPLSLDDFLTSSNKGYIPIVSDMEMEPTVNPEAADDNTETKELENSEKVVKDGVADVPVIVYGPNTEPIVSDMEMEPTVNPEAADDNTETEELENSEKVVKDGVADVPVIVYGPNTEPIVSDMEMEPTVNPEAADDNTETEELENSEKVAKDGVADVPVIVYGPNTEPIVSDMEMEPTVNPEATDGSTETRVLENSEKVAEDGVVDVPVIVYGPNTEPETEKTELSLEPDQTMSSSDPPVSNPSPSPPALVDQEINSPKHDEDDHNEDIEDKRSDVDDPTSLPQIIGPQAASSSTSSLDNENCGNESQGCIREDLDDTKLFGIDHASQVPMPEIRPPPSPLPLLYQQNDETEMEDKSEMPAEDVENTSPPQ